MTSKKSNPCEIASDNLFTEFPKHYNYGAFINGLQNSATTTFDHLKPGKSATLFVLEYVRKHPGTTPTKIRSAYKKGISNNLFQNLRWAKLVTPRKYTLTELGHQLLKHYNI